MLNFNTAQEASFGRVTVESGSLEDRLVFIKKVYTLLAASMATAAIGAYLGTGPLLPIVASNRMILFILMIGLIFFAQFARHKPGLNMIALFSFTTVSGLTLGPLLYAVGPSIATHDHWLMIGNIKSEWWFSAEHRLPIVESGCLRPLIFNTSVQSKATFIVGKRQCLLE